MPTPLTLLQLQSWCQQIFTFNYPYYPWAADYFNTLYLYGVRTTEPFDVSRWSIDNTGNILLQPLKGNNIRTFGSAGFPAAFKDSILRQERPFNGLTLHQASSLFNRLRKQRRIVTARKIEEFYPFRYYRIKLRHQQGQTDQQIADFMGYTSTAVVSNYLSQVLYFEQF